MTCYHCGATTEGESDICAICGRPQPAPEGQIPSRAALAYYERIRRKMRAENGEPLADEPHAPDAPVVRRNPNRKPTGNAVRNAGSQGPKRPVALNDKSKEASVAPRKLSSVPPGGSMSERPGAPPPQASRMVRHYEYEAIGPKPGQHDRFNWIRLCIIAFVCVLVITVGLYVFLKNSDAGQLWLASHGREASMGAYHALGRELMNDGSIHRAIAAFEIAQSKAPDDLEVLLDLGRAYLADDQINSAELAYTRAIQVNQIHPEPYLRIINIMRDQVRNYEALQLSKIAFEQTGDDQFDIIYRELIPKTPGILDNKPLGGTYVEEKEVTLVCDDPDAVIYYTLDNTDPKTSETRMIFRTGEAAAGEKEEDKQQPIQLTEEGIGRSWYLRAVSFRDDMYSEELIQYYYINKPHPDMPSATLAPNSYETVRTVSLVSKDKNDLIYYTTDGSDPTVRSKLFEEPIKLRIGTTVLKAIAVNLDGKVSNILTLEYKCGGTSKTSMTEDDVIDKLALHKTTKQAFIDTYGAPASETQDGEDANGTYTMLRYAFGHATFFQPFESQGEPVLAELSVISPAFAGPRKTAVGVRMEEVLGAFRDEGGEENAQGMRRLYKRNGGILGILERLDGDDADYKIGYYLPVKNNQYIELSYFAKDGLIIRMEWLRYDHDLVE